MMKNRPGPAVFLDRDGTINEQMGYINHVSRFHLLPHAAEGIRLLNEHRIPVVVVSNQSGVARGYFPERLVHRVHDRMKLLLAEQGAHVDGIYICPHHPEAKEKKYRLQCTCRKPKTGMIELAAAELGLDPSRSFLVGDRWSDLRCAARAGCTPVLVLTGYGRGDKEYIGPGQEVQPEFTGENLLEAAEWIIRQMEGVSE
jgi:D-glycero-D-manno-heptose 1,7-bisphosphate phosphatase